MGVLSSWSTADGDWEPTSRRGPVILQPEKWEERVRLSLSPKGDLIRRLRFQLLYSVILHAHGAVGTRCLRRQRMGDVRL